MQSKRIAMGIRYDGTAYHGWQAQFGELATLQSKVEKAISCVANHSVAVTCAGRTDAGVHATQQVIHFDSDADRTENAWVFGANSHLPPDISVVWAQDVDNEFHARFSATSRRYRYILYNYKVRPGILRHAVGWHHKQLDESEMQQAAMHLIGEHDFSSFRGAGCQAKTAKRTVTEVAISRHKHLLIIEIEANAFLLHMVRNIVGSLFAVGSGYRDSDWMAEVLAAKDRREAGITASPSGLYLVEVNYPGVYSLPKIPIGPFFLHGTML
ncbi:MAG: tRNA pseudouridine(38-40) synthase TruA [Coxiellaceae bacterium]|nr:tRNA pseudouridine(38-40) synthase TruA [Coxiellaceae bacterium]